MVIIWSTFIPFVHSEHCPCSLCFRYNVKCAKDQLLSYSFVVHSLEGRGRCSGSSECLDRLTMKLPNYGNYVLTTCASDVQTDILFQDGLNELSVQFVANRWKQYPGFYMFVWCIHRDFQLGSAPTAVGQGRSQLHSPSCTLTPADMGSSQQAERRRRKRVRSFYCHCIRQSGSSQPAVESPSVSPFNQ